MWDIGLVYGHPETKVSSLTAKPKQAMKWTVVGNVSVAANNATTVVLPQTSAVSRGSSRSVATTFDLQLSGESMTLAPAHAFDGTASPDTGDNGSPIAQEGRFVINLCSVTAPIPIPQPRSSQLMKYRFFLSHCWEEGRRRYRLHMGYFPTVAEAQKWLDMLRRVYPSAFVGEAPAEQPDPLGYTEILRILEQPGADLLERGGGARRPVQAPRPAPPYSSSEKREVKGGITTRTRDRQAASALRESLEALGASEFDMHDDELNSTGVRHLCVEVRKDRPDTRSTKGAASRTRKL